MHVAGLLIMIIIIIPVDAAIVALVR